MTAIPKHYFKYLNYENINIEYPGCSDYTNKF